MTSAKCFINWMKEAGRGHLVAALGWGMFILYGILAVTRLSFDTQSTYFGIGGTVLELRWICMGLGILTAFIEFFYLFRQRQQDFYYSLPVSRGTVFWSRYVHGLFHVLVPLILVMAVCGLYQAAIDPQFGPYVGSYTLKSILVYGASYLIFYHLGILCIVICGNIVSAIAVCAAGILYFPILTGNICITLSENYFISYYKNPLLERLYTVLSPERLTADLTGMSVFEKPFVLSFTPGMSSIAAAVLWIGIPFVLFAFAQGKRKTERTGRIFVFALAERTVQLLISFLAGLWIFSFLSDFNFMGAASVGFGNLIACAAGGVCAALVIHCLLEYAVQGTGAKLLRRKWQLAVSAVAVLAAGLAFPAGASAYDSYFPEDAGSVGISIDGIGMDYWTYSEVSGKRETYETNAQLNEYRLKGEGRTAVLGWLQEIIRNDPGENEGADDAPYTRAKVCYYMSDGSTCYRSYPLNREQVEMFAAVYETDEYRQIAYPAVTLEDVSDDRFTWEDGVKGAALQITGDQKEALLNVYREDVSGLRMEQLEEELPCGYVRIKSSKNGEITDMFVYPFFERTCKLLGEYGVDTEKTLGDYEVDSIQEMESLPAAGTGGLSSGGTHMNYYEQADEVAELKQKLVPDELDIQPLLYPLDHSSDIDASVVDEETTSIIHVSCVQHKGE